MDEASARGLVEKQFDVSRETMDRFDAFIALLREENERQNLVSRASVGEVWRRHILDSAQLLRWAPARGSIWIDLGTGAGFPGLIVAALHRGPVSLVEERALRVDFLRRAIEMLGLGGRVELLGSRVERVERRRFDVISARAFAPLPRLFDLATRFSTQKTLFILPRGRNAGAELAAARSSWQGGFRLEPSLTDADARILLAQGVRRRKSV